MDGGIDLVYMGHFGHQIQDRVRSMIFRRGDEKLPVGAAEVVATGDAHIPWMIVAPTMEVPQHIPALNTERAFMAMLRTWRHHPEIDTVYCPGFGTGVGAVPPNEAAASMAAAFRFLKKGALSSPQKLYRRI